MKMTISSLKNLYNCRYPRNVKQGPKIRNAEGGFHIIEGRRSSGLGESKMQQRKEMKNSSQFGNGKAK